MQLISTETKERTVNIPVPSFWKDPRHADYIAVINDKKVVSLFQIDDTIIIRHNNPISTKDEIVKAVENWQAITKDEFMDIYAAVLRSVNLENVF